MKGLEEIKRDNAERELEEVFYHFAVAQDMPDGKLLRDFIRLYPQYEKELTEFAAELWTDLQEHKK